MRGYSGRRARFSSPPAGKSREASNGSTAISIQHDRGCAAMMIVFPVVADGQYRVYEVDLTSSEQYTGVMTRLRLDPVLIAGTEGHVRVKSISFQKPAAAAQIRIKSE
jgi:hypothetical protein